MALDVIRIHSTAPPVDVLAEDVYFPFASGRFRYDCVSCKAQCCRGHGYFMRIGEELRTQLKRRPQVGFFLTERPRATGQVLMRNCPPGCFFLNEQNLCGIQAESGYDSKPETCRLFPFNQIRRVGKYLLVAPHPSLCPLDVGPPADPSPLSRHEVLLEGLAGHGIAAEVPVAGVLPPVAGDTGLDRVIRLEREIVALSQAADVAHYGSFVAAQLQATAAAFGPAPPEGGADLDHGSSALAYLRRACSVLDVSVDEVLAPRPALTRTMVSLTPVVRHMIVFPDPSAAVSSPCRMSLDRVPYVLYGLYLVAWLAETAGMRQVTYQTVVRLFHDFKDLLVLLAYGDAVMTWQAGIRIDLSPTGQSSFNRQYLRIARTLLRSAQSGTRLPLAAAMSAHNPFHGASRAAFLRLLTQRLTGRIVFFAPGTPRGAARRRPPLRNRLQHWLVGGVHENLLRAVASPALGRRLLSRRLRVPL
jgi:hypothetical protein